MNINKDYINYFNNLYKCKDIVKKSDGEFNIILNIDKPDSTKIIYWAANPPNYNSSYTGSGIPFANPNIAFENSPNIGSGYIKNKLLEINIYYPNSFYASYGTKYIGPVLFYKICNDNELDKLTIKSNNVNEIKIIDLKNSIPFRNCNYSYKTINGPSFYQNHNKKLRTQEEILRDSHYPYKNITPNNFWGNKIPN